MKERSYDGRLPLAYRNQEFMDTPDARALRILSEYLYPHAQFRHQRIHDTIVFFGSARLAEDGPDGRYYDDARELALRVTKWSDSLAESSRRFRSVQRRRTGNHGSRQSRCERGGWQDHRVEHRVAV
jgi:hypothetical protein